LVSGQVLKSLTSEITIDFHVLLGNEVRYQDKLISDLDDDMDRTGGFMNNTIGRVMRLSKHKRGYTCYMLLFALLVFFILYLVIKFR
jgi:blocked early in transport 1